MKKSIIWILAIILLLISQNYTYAYSEDTGVVPVRDFEILKDEQGQYLFNEVDSPDLPNSFRPYQGEYINLGIQTSVYWVRFSVPRVNEGFLSHGAFIQLKNPNIDKLDVYIPTSKGYQIREVGSYRPSENREVFHNSWVFSLPRDFLETQPIYLRLESTAALRLPVLLWQQEAFIKDAFLNYSGFGSFYGILLMMSLFNFLVYMMLRERLYLYYTLYILGMFLYHFQVQGHLRMVLDLPAWLYNGVFWLVLGSTQIFSVLFAQTFLQLSQKSVSYRMLQGLLGLAVVQAVMGLLEWNIYANQLAHGLGLGGPLLMMGIAVGRWRKGFTAARYYLAAWSFLFFGIVCWALSAYVVMPFPAVNYLMVGTLCETLLLSYALADRVKILQRTTRLLAKKVSHYRDLSRLDELTGLYNKRSMRELLAPEVEQSTNGQGRLVLMVLDIDYFKRYNDTFGHWAGDQVLKQVGVTLRQMLGEEDMGFRYGGEEFLVSLANRSREQAIALAETIREAFHRQPFYPAGKREFVTISIGLAECKKGDTLESLFQRADEALYMAKNNGRNQVQYA